MQGVPERRAHRRTASPQQVHAFPSDARCAPCGKARHVSQGQPGHIRAPTPQHNRAYPLRALRHQRRASTGSGAKGADPEVTRVRVLRDVG